MRKIFFGIAFLLIAAEAGAFFVWKPGLYSLALVGPILLLGFWDALQTKQAVRRNFPVIGWGRYLLEAIRPELHQYFVETDQEGRPFNREQRSIVYQRAKGQLQTLPFGTRKDVYANGYEWFNHSLVPKHVSASGLRVEIGGEDCAKPYSASLFNISAMSFGSLSTNAVLALNAGAKRGSFAHNTGEGGVSSYHQEPGGDLIWQVGTGYFGCRADDGTFSPEKFAETASIESVKMIELKLSQGAKPGHGGILPAAKISKEIAEIRGVPLGKDVISPPAHSSFDSPRGLLRFIDQLRTLSGGKPVGFKLCIGKRREFLAILKAMQELEIYPDFISIDGGEGGTGAAPLEFSNRLGTPMFDGLIFAHNALVGFGLRDHVKVIVSGKILSATRILKACALGADVCYSARGMMISLGCIQALRCNSNHCPVGIATQHPGLVAGLDPTNKAERVWRYHQETMDAVAEMLGAMGLSHTDELQPWHVLRRTGPTNIANYSELYEYLEPESLLRDPLPPHFARAMEAANADSFHA